MNWSRSSRLALALLVLVGAVAAPVAAVSVSGENVPDTAKVGEKQATATYEITEPFSEYEQWTLVGETEMSQVNWQVETYNNAGNQIDEQTFTGNSFQYDLAAQDGVVRVEVTVVATTPDVSNWSYAPSQKLTFAEFSQTQQGGASTVLVTDTVRPYTEDSQAARDAIDEAQTAIDEAESAGASTQEAANLLNNAISAFDNGNFENAQSLATQAEERATSAQQSTQQTNTLLMVGGGIVVVLILVGVGYWYLQQRDTYDKLG